MRESARGPTARARCRASRRRRSARRSRRRARAACAASRRTPRRRSTRRRRAGRNDALACRLMNRSALLLLAIAVAIVDRHAAVVVARQQHADAEPRFDRRLDAARDGERQILFLRAARRPSTPSSSPPWPGSIAMVRIGGAGCAERGRQLRAAVCGAAAAAAALARRRSVCAADEVDHQPRRGVDRLARRPGSRRTAARDRPRAWWRRRAGSPGRSPARLRRQRRVATSSASASNLTRGARVLRDGRCGARRRVDRQAPGGAERIVADRDARHAQVADDQQVRRLAQVEPRVVDRARARG